MLWFKMCNSRGLETVVSHEHSKLYGVEISAAMLNSHQLFTFYLFQKAIIVSLNDVYIYYFNFKHSDDLLAPLVSV